MPVVPDDRKIVLHVGCGLPEPEKLHERFRGPEWHEVRFDINPAVEPDVVGDIVDMANVEPGSVDAVWSSHNLEHVFAHEVVAVLAEFHRVLRPGGEVLVTMPDLQRVAELIARGKLEDPIYDSPAGPIAPLDVVYGHGSSVANGNEFMAHRTGFTMRTLRQRMLDAGFVDVVVKRDRNALWGSGRRPA